MKRIFATLALVLFLVGCGGGGGGGSSSSDSPLPTSNPLSGTWRGTWTIPAYGANGAVVINMNQIGYTIDGTYIITGHAEDTGTFFGQLSERQPPCDVTLNGSSVKMTGRADSANSMSGTFISSQGYEGTFSATK